MTEQNSLDKFRSKEVEERFQELISGVVNEEFENMNTALDPQPVGCSKDGTECRIRFIKKDWERNQRMQVHGGAVSGMMDTAMGMSIMAKSGRPVTTAELNVSFIRPFLGESFLIDTEILYMGRNLIRTRFCLCRIEAAHPAAEKTTPIRTKIFRPGSGFFMRLVCCINKTLHEVERVQQCCLSVFGIEPV